MVVKIAKTFFWKLAVTFELTTNVTKIVQMLLFLKFTLIMGLLYMIISFFKTKTKLIVLEVY